MSITCTTPYRAPIVKPPLEIDLLPYYGLGRLEEYDPEDKHFWIVFGTQHKDYQQQKFILPTAEEYDYYYYMAPVEYGAATFTYNGLMGGWDGASWPLDDMGEVYGPVEIEIQGHKWNLWRSDWPGNMGGVYSVRFENA